MDEKKHSGTPAATVRKVAKDDERGTEKELGISPSSHYTVG